MGFPCGSVEKNPAANAGEAGLIPGFGKIPLEEEMTSHSSILARRIPWTEVYMTGHPCSYFPLGPNPQGALLF